MCVHAGVCGIPGHIVDAQGLHATPEKLQAIEEAPAPEDMNQLRFFLGLLNYYGKFIPNLASIIQPLNALLRKDTKWHWDESCSSAFNVAKQSLMSNKVLVHFDPSLPLRLARDMSSYGVGAVISHVRLDGSDWPITFVSRTLNRITVREGGLVTDFWSPQVSSVDLSFC